MSKNNNHKKSVGRLEPIEIMGVDGKRISANAKLDTGADRTSVDSSLVDNLGNPDKLNGTAKTTSGDTSEERSLIPIYVELPEYTSLRIVAAANIADRNKTGDVLIGHPTLAKMSVVVDPAVENWSPE